MIKTKNHQKWVKRETNRLVMTKSKKNSEIESFAYASLYGKLLDKLNLDRKTIKIQFLVICKQKRKHGNSNQK